MLVTRLNQLKEVAIDLLFPPRCVGCGKMGELFCDSCKGTLSPIIGPLCPRCGRPFPSQRLCPDCEEEPPQIDGVRSVFLFDEMIREAIHHFKYRNLKALATPLGRSLADYLHSNTLPAQILVPVPLHPQRLRQRGYNQSALLCNELSRYAGLPVIEGCLVRLRQTVAQARAANAAQRRSNVERAFSCRDQRLQGKHVLLIDDVCTTGATLEACAIAMKAAGTASVWGLTLAREI